MRIELFENKKEAIVNGEKIILNTEPIIHCDRLLVPTRFICETIGLNVLWDDKERKAVIFDRQTRFDTMDECAVDFFMYWNAPSIGLFREIGATIKWDKEGYYWTSVFVGNQKSIPEYKFDLKNAVAILHTHGGTGGADYFSKEDITLAEKNNMPIYMASPVGHCWVYDTIAKETEMFYDGVPTDLRKLPQYKNYDMRANIELFNDYFAPYHELTDEPMGYLADYYNKLYSQGKCYTLRVDADNEGEIIV